MRVSFLRSGVSLGHFLLIVLAYPVVALSTGGGGARADERSDYEHAIPPALRGPFVSRSDVVPLLECPDSACKGPLNFARLIEARLPSHMTHVIADDNPFNHIVSKKIVDTISKDIEERSKAAGVYGNRLNEKFLIDANSRVQLVGVVNRMDRQFMKDTARARGEQRNCCEISVIYRFFYSIREGRQKSRLPVTMNLVFPALPSDTRGGQITCASVAKRWVDEMARPTDRTPAQIAHDLLDLNTGPLALIDGRDLERLELNVQAYRAKASDAAAAGFGTRAEYIIRIFQWSEKANAFVPRFLNSQIDHDSLRCAVEGRADCAWKERLRRKLVRYLQRPEVVSAIDLGELDIPVSIKETDDRGETHLALSFRGISIAPGGAHRSGNRPFWKATPDQGTAAQKMLSDDEIRIAFANAKNAGVQLRFIGTPGDFRIRLDQMSCTGCHQTRAIAGFHFPGADREGTPDSNAVYLPGSPHFYGDQPRRIEIVSSIMNAGRASLPVQRLAMSYADRPDDRYDRQLEGTEIRGGWGASCIANPSAASRRNWGCKGDLVCDPVFDAAEGEDRDGICRPARAKTQIGDPLQTGRVTVRGFDRDAYTRVTPELPADRSDTRIPPSALPSNPPEHNSFYGAHQEYYEGDKDSKDKATRRDAQTGGFPAGMLRLSECVGLPSEATCGLVAASGFNDCIGKMSDDPRFNTDVCFTHFTAFAGMRACDAASPCRDDYICVKPIKGFSSVEEAEKTFKARRKQLRHSDIDFRGIIKAPAYDPTGYGEAQPDADWVRRQDRRGYCIPPYFVFQFRSDGHPPP